MGLISQNSFAIGIGAICTFATVSSEAVIPFIGASLSLQVQSVCKDFVAAGPDMVRLPSNGGSMTLTSSISMDSVTGSNDGFKRQGSGQNHRMRGTSVSGRGFGQITVSPSGA